MILFSVYVVHVDIPPYTTLHLFGFLMLFDSPPMFMFIIIIMTLSFVVPFV